MKIRVWAHTGAAEMNIMLWVWNGMGNCLREGEMSKTISTAEVNHLRLLLGWVRCEVGQDHNEIIETMKSIAPTVQLHELSNDSKQRLVDAYNKSIKVPKYVRRAIKQLELVVIESQGEIVDAQQMPTVRAR